MLYYMYTSLEYIAIKYFYIILKVFFDITSIQLE